MNERTRRQFLEQSMFAAAGLAAAGVSRGVAFAEEKQSKSPNERLSVAVVGVRGRGGEHLQAFSGRKDTEVTYIVDADEAVGRKRAADIAERQGGRAPKFVTDMRKAFEDPSVDIVSTATPNHWHALTAIWAMQHGKDVYVEKPVSHNVSEGRRIVETARKYQKICQTGTQCRSTQGMRAAMQYLHDGKLGNVSVARGLCYKPRPSIGPRGDYQVPGSVDYDLWLGPAPQATLTRPQFHYDWHWQWAYGNGDLGNQGIHQMDLARWGLGVSTLSHHVLSYGGRLGYEDAGETANTQVVVHDYGDKSLIFETRGLPTGPYKPTSVELGAGVGVIFEGTEGYLVMTSYDSGAAFNKKGEQIQKFSGGGDHFGNFISAVRSRNTSDLHADILDGHLSSALCHLGNISYRLGSQVAVGEAKERLQGVQTHDNALDTFERTMQHLADNKVDVSSLKLQFGQPLAFDPGVETFIDNSAADAMLTREYRAPFVVPSADKI